MGDIYIPIIFVTVLSEGFSLSRAHRFGGDDFISKPFDARVLGSKDSAYLRMRELGNQLI